MHYGSVALVYLSADVVFVFAGHEWPYPGPIPGVALMDRFMKIVNIIGGIGNQMFQYAFAMSLKAKNPEEEVLIDTSHFNGYRLHTGFELKRVFDVKLSPARRGQIARLSYYIPHYTVSRALRRVLPVRRSEYIEPKAFRYDSSALDALGSLYFEGYWQSPRYFEQCAAAVVEAFRFPEFYDQLNLNAARLLGEQNSVAIHVRRGDFVGAAIFSGICTLEYYMKALEQVFELIKTPTFFIFSIDMDWCREHIIPLLRGADAHFIDFNTGQKSYRDMQLMSLARGCIIANSSFSWWGAWLNARPDKFVVAPMRWANCSDSSDIYPAGWILV